MGSRGPLPKDPAKLHGHRQKAKVEPAPLPEAFVVPSPRDEWREDTKQAWQTYWASDLAILALSVDAPSITRLFGMYDQHARAMEVVSKALVVKGSTGQLRTNPLADHALRLDAAILRLEGELGLTPGARARMGIAMKRPVPQPTTAPESTPSRYAHLRTVAS